MQRGSYTWDECYSPKEDHNGSWKCLEVIVAVNRRRVIERDFTERLHQQQ